MSDIEYNLSTTAFNNIVAAVVAQVESDLGTPMAVTTYDPATISEQVAGLTATQTLTNKTLGSGTTAGTSLITAGTPQSATSGTSHDFTGIPSWAKRITILLNGISLSGTADLLVQIGNGSIVTSGYATAVTAMSTGIASVNQSSGFQFSAGGAAVTQSGVLSFYLIDSTNNIWVADGATGRTDAAGTRVDGGRVALSGSLDRIRVTTTNGTDTFDAGSVNIFYE